MTIGTCKVCPFHHISPSYSPYLTQPCDVLELCLSFTFLCCIACFRQGSPFWSGAVKLTRHFKSLQMCRQSRVSPHTPSFRCVTGRFQQVCCPLLASDWSMDGCRQNIRKSCWVLKQNFLSHGQRSADAAAPAAPAGFPAHHPQRCRCSAERWEAAVS